MRPGQPVPHPGWMLQEWLQQSGWRQARLAQELVISVKHVNEILNGHALWSVELAAKIEKVTGIPAMRLMTAKNEYLLSRQGLRG